MKLTLFHQKDHIEIFAIEWTELMHRIRTGYWRDIVEKCQNEAMGMDELKKRLPAFGVSVTFTGGDEAANVVRYNHIVCIDFNKVISHDEKGMERIDQCRDICRDIPSVIGFYVTKSGMGFRVFVLVNTGMDEHKMIYHPLQEYFEQMFNLQADDKYIDVTRLSFVGYDPDCFFRNVENFEPMDMGILVPEIKNKKLKKDIPDIENKVCGFLNSRYEFRYNTLLRCLEGRVKVSLKNALPESVNWRTVDDRFNDLLVKYVNDGLTYITYNQFKWILDNYVGKAIYDPIKDFDSILPDWDRKDRIGDFARLLSTNDSAYFADTFTSWAVDMYKSLTRPSFQNNRILILESQARYSGKTEWILGIIPENLRKYTIATNINFVCDINHYVLAIIEDYDSKDLSPIKRLMENNKKLSVVITTSRELNISGKGIKVDHFVINKKDGSENIAPIDYINFYSQLKYLASK
ncbi:BT4734/BF3469 family protein [Xylanibacter oryzae]|uniref:BT4734/BF3469 family protein n=1 Tax=Xylanibacter oryzae TaxID=185293 RepID=UPI0004BA8A18|nr:BT4734/BF3469 family protein [Xylanibacter oryzae]